ncbi:carbohydrate kinase FGGY [Thermosulfidibacter takaii ABI70S6]|uniref:Carbohydrate kinase FGGY n=1 Tax=Thermosulfidibacter takaii (strain DSM 17441 / JCM 13301 / NBRC 103674 / ABI70S6) TaxID=1298851 RepID=A0A0S3QS68_THET7|nr:FGGY-family carbohydrate kinase [Thermosulfidibacter takaii]BAT71164.1 carbohydrate kinase FGGY [Thermosulfidibacter takaii ABI70S6]
MATGDEKLCKDPSKLLLATIDVGTQSLKVGAFTGEGELKELVKLYYKEPYSSPQEGFAEKDPDEYWEYIKKAFKLLWDSGINPSNIKAVCVTSQRATTLFLDENFKPLRPAILWLDQRKAQNPPKLGFLEFLFKIILLHKNLKEVQKKCPVNWVIENEPDTWEKTKRVCFLSTYINHKLTGKYIDSVANQVGYLPFNFKRQCWEKENNWKYKLFPVKREMLPELKSPSSTLGLVTQTAAQEIGLPKGIPVISGASDKACEVIGTGCTHPWQGCLGYGTTATINVNHSKYVEPFLFNPAYPSAIPEEYNIEYQVFRGFWLVTWFKQLAGKTEKELEELAKKVPPGCHGLVFQPYWNQGVRYPGMHARGCIVGFRDYHHRHHIYRALIEGLIFALKEGKEFIQRKTKIAIKELHISGGGSQSDLVAQCTADIMNLPVKRPRYSETSSLGAVILAATGIGIYPNVKTAIEHMIQDATTFQPIKENAELYDKLYKRIFKKLLPCLTPTYKELYKIFG